MFLKEWRCLWKLTKHPISNIETYSDDSGLWNHFFWFCLCSFILCQLHLFSSSFVATTHTKRERHMSDSWSDSYPSNEEKCTCEWVLISCRIIQDVTTIWPSYITRARICPNSMCNPANKSEAENRFHWKIKCAKFHIAVINQWTCPVWIISQLSVLWLPAPVSALGDLGDLQLKHSPFSLAASTFPSLSLHRSHLHRALYSFTSIQKVSAWSQ